MKRIIKRLIAVTIIATALFGLIGIVSASSSATSKNVSFYYSGTSTGSREYSAFYLNAANQYTFSEISHSGSCNGITAIINGVIIGNLTCNALNYGGYPVSYQASVGNPYIEVSFRHGTGIARSSILVEGE